MKIAALAGAALLLQAAAGPPVAQPRYMRYMRALSVPQPSGQGCATLDADTFAHAAPSLIDLRIFPSAAQAAGGAALREVPYAITMSESANQDTTEARVLNLGENGRSISFDLQMPQRPYSTVDLELDPALHDFLGTATVVASDQLGAKARTVSFGSFTVFDLTAQHLSRSTRLMLPESTFPYLRVTLAMSDAPGGDAPQSGAARFVPSVVEGAVVPPSRETQAIYTTVEQSGGAAVSGRESVARFEIPARVPVERIAFVVAPGFKGNFSRDVRITATAERPTKGSRATGVSAVNSDAGGMEEDTRPPVPEVVTGTILRVNANEAGRQIATEQLTVPAVLGANLQQPAKVEVAIENGDDQPLPIVGVKLEMRERRLCFDTSAAAAGQIALYYGDPALFAPVYEYERLFTPAEKPVAVALGPQLANPDFRPRPGPPLSFTERHPEVLWIALVLAIAALGLVALRSGKSVGRA